MEKELLGTSRFSDRNNGSTDGFFPAFDMPAMIDKMKHEQTWKRGELSSIVLIKRPDMKIMLTVMHEGTEVMSSSSNGSVTFQIIEGKLMMHIKKESFPLNKGEKLTLEEKGGYSFDSIEETAFLLTLVPENQHPGNRTKE